MGGSSPPNLHCSAEYGEEWHQAGTKLEQAGVFDDFITASEWLIANGYTSQHANLLLVAAKGTVGGCLHDPAMLFAAARCQLWCDGYVAVCSVIYDWLGGRLSMVSRNQRSSKLSVLSIT